MYCKSLRVINELKIIRVPRGGLTPTSDRGAYAKDSIPLGFTDNYPWKRPNKKKKKKCTFEFTYVS